MNRTIVSVVCFLIVNAAPVRSQEAELTGTISLPVSAVLKRRVFPGSIYRNRRSAARKFSKKEEAAPSAFERVVISAHPLTFQASPKPLAQPVEIMQVDAAFSPHVVAVTNNSVVRFINSDKIYHNVFSLTPGMKFNIGRRPTGDAVDQQITVLGEIKVFCDIHPQMNAIILSLGTPYFTQPESNGQYALRNQPPGTYEIRVYHPDLADIKHRIELQSGEKRTEDLTLFR